MYISAYAFLAPRTGALVRQLKEWHIPYVLSGDGFWQDYGAPEDVYKRQVLSRRYLRKPVQIVCIILCVLLALASAAYIGLTILFVDAVQNQPPVS